MNTATKVFISYDGNHYNIDVYIYIYIYIKGSFKKSLLGFRFVAHLLLLYEPHLNRN